LEKKMGTYLAVPVIEKEKFEVDAKRFKVACCHMQGWRTS